MGMGQVADEADGLWMECCQAGAEYLCEEIERVLRTYRTKRLQRGVWGVRSTADVDSSGTGKGRWLVVSKKLLGKLGL